MKYFKKPYWLKNKYYCRFAGTWHKRDPNERVIEQRLAIFKIDPSIKPEKVDDILRYFRDFYRGEPWFGLSKRDRAKLWKEKNGICCICGERVEFGQMTVEHLKDQIECLVDDENPHQWDNYGIAHGECNSLKRNSFSNENKK